MLCEEIGAELLALVIPADVYCQGREIPFHLCASPLRESLAEVMCREHLHLGLSGESEMRCSWCKALAD
ncbi:Zinc finger, LSD1-type containing protein [Cricetulus griseus]|nr:Zinc finger, LSD1-type containing protein [Cricetulus griseus]